MHIQKEGNQYLFLQNKDAWTQYVLGQGQVRTLLDTSDVFVRHRPRNAGTCPRYHVSHTEQVSEISLISILSGSVHVSCFAEML